MYKVRTYNNISVKGLERFSRENYEVASEISHPQAFLLRSQKLHDEPFPESVKAVARAGAGTNNVPIEDCTKKGIVVFNTPGANANAVKELVMAGLLLASRDIAGGMAYAQSLTNISDAGEMSKLLEKEKKRFAGSELTGKSLGIVGLGAIGSMVADMALAMGMKVLGYDPALSVEAAWRLSSDVQRMENLQSLLAHSDFITLHVPAIEQTHHLINSETLQSVKDGAVLLNFARDQIVDTNSVVSALKQNKLGRYVCDFPEPLLLGLEKVIAMPHIGASTSEAEENCAVMAADQLKDFLENGNIKNSVNFPAIAMARTEGYRITFSNDNVPKVLGNVLSILADHNVNVIDMLNKSRNDVAYSIIDVESEPSGDVIGAIADTQHVIDVRVV